MKKSIAFTCIGVFLILLGFVLLKTVSASQGFFAVLPYICLGIGCGTIGHGIGDLVNICTFKKYPNLKKQAEIEEKDERNIAVSNRAKGKAYDLMLYLFGALMIIYVLMDADLSVILLLVASYLIVTAVFIYYLVRYQKEM